MRVTERDIEIIRFINEFGFCEIEHIGKQFCLSKAYGYEVMRRLKKNRLVCHSRIFHNRPGVFTVTAKGADYTNLPPIKKISIGQYEHQICIINVNQRLRHLYPNLRWVSERQLKHDKFYNGIGKRGHISDGILIAADGNQIAIEVELSVKGKNRVEKIIKGYAGEFDIKEVWYFGTPTVIYMLKSLTIKMPFVIIHNIDEFLS